MIVGDISLSQTANVGGEESIAYQLSVVAPGGRYGDGRSHKIVGSMTEVVGGFDALHQAAVEENIVQMYTALLNGLCKARGLNFIGATSLCGHITIHVAIRSDVDPKTEWALRGD